ncbi:hypothetical protein PybrP1_002342 [[Pythium] brassicae (nom. inval.)]|nr:hypothetical protein PybrP1_002342 [[Pythium] brassicae (nom. inval.)]
MSLVLQADPREEMDAAAPTARPKAAPTVATAPTAGPAALKTKFLIRTLPRDCNPTPVTAATTPLLSPASARRPPLLKSPASTTAADRDEHLPDNPFDDITEDKLQKLSGKQDLARVTYLQISVDSGKQSVEAIGELLPSLQQLKLQNSTLHSFRDLGTSLHSLQILWVIRSGISDLDGIGALTGLQELYLQYNDISDLSPLTLHEEIQVIDLEGNCIEDIGQVEQLAFCAQLTTLNLEANPVCRIAHYRQIIANFLPQLTTLDDKPVADGERAKISDEEIDAAINAHREALLAERAASVATDDKFLIADGIKMSVVVGSHSDERSPRKLSRDSSAQRLAGFDAIAEARKNDSGSTLTHGTDIVFAGNVTSSLRRHRSENESDSHFAALAEPLAAAAADATGSAACGPLPQSANGGSSDGGGVFVPPPLLERPKTPARMSITDTLDRAHELETQRHKSRDAILNELKAWQQEGAVSQVGVTHFASHRREKGGERAGSKASPKRREPSSRSKPRERRPNTSAGVLRNGASSPAPLHHRSSYSSASTASSSSNHVDILILDESDERRPCSPTKSSKGIFTAGHGSREWNLDALSPKLDLTTAESSWRNFPQAGGAERHQNDRVLRHTRRENDEGSSSSEGESFSDRARGTARKKATVQPRGSQGAATFFNVAESLHAIDRWRDGMDDADDKNIVRVASYQLKRVASRTAGTTTAAAEIAPHNSSSSEQQDAVSSILSASSAPSTSLNQFDHQSEQQQQEQRPRQPSPDQLGPANFETDERIVQFMCEKHKSMAETKTRDGFRRFFKGIEAERLERILQRVFADPEKVRRRLQLMTGFYRHELPS